MPTLNSEEAVIQGTVTSTGGTGRFVNVIFEADFTGQIYLIDDMGIMYYTYTGEGTISY